MATAQLPALARKPSLRRRVVRRVVWRLTLTWFVGTTLAVVIATIFTQQAYDRSLLDDASALASNVGQSGDALRLNLSPHEVSTVLFDQVESVFFAVLRPDGSLVAGHGGLHTPAAPAGLPFHFDDIVFQGKRLRAVTLHRMEPFAFDVILAQTTLSRSALLRSLLVFSIVPQILLLALLAWWLRRAIQRDLQPLAELQRAVDQRDAQDLTPVPVSASTGDVERLGEAINSLLARVEHGVRAQREFAGNVAHELRTPLAGIRALADYGLAHQEPAVWRQQLQDIAASQARASRLVDQLLALALAAEAHAGLPMTEVRLDEVARETVLRALPRADAAGVDLGAQGLEQPVLVRGHAALIEGIVSNLLDNALRYGLAGAGRVSRITVALASHAGSVRLSVVDSGPGLSPGQHEAVLQRWAQGPAGEKLGQGAGLGLAIVAQYARVMGAQVELVPAADGPGLEASVVFAALAPGAPSPAAG